MQVFRPYIDWERSAAVLDDLRLGKQRVEAKQVLNVIFRKLGLIRDNKRGWLNHPIVLLYFNNGKPYIEDIVGFFHACVNEWKRRGKQNSISLDDLRPFVESVEKTYGTPVTHLHEVEYRRVLLMKSLKHYIKAFPRPEIYEVLETEPVKIHGVNTWLFKDLQVYKSFVKKVRSML